ncbi:unnamed protein product [Rotaria sp. Silwood1]|nr:unnamed protein product [Rotaria sp. Silwood1]CAF1665005.1 unnamed protein product [Rotaria sp. Silwood1]CAF3839335.1 unnamed protein product [Rotaria sp. Silwood1]CAF4849010.1 unnamed protein product [Rotaria sp. Silwood1]
MTTVSSSGSSCLSPIRYSLDVSQINQSLPSEKPTNFDQNIISIPMEDIQLNQLSLPIDDSSVEPVCHAQNYSSGQILRPVLSTPGYLSPEILMQDENHTTGVDFGALGVCIYQFVVGIAPFSDDCPRE